MWRYFAENVPIRKDQKMRPSCFGGYLVPRGPKVVQNCDYYEE
jgi:hypothetical protein